MEWTILTIPKFSILAPHFHIAAFALAKYTSLSTQQLTGVVWSTHGPGQSDK